MQEILHSRYMMEARKAILDRFHILNTPPRGTAARRMFIDEETQYRGGYFACAFERLVAEGHAEILRQGLFFRLTETGYEEARS